MLDKRGLLLIISGPSGVGKGTVIKELKDDSVFVSVSATTRKKREHEMDGIHYHFKTKEEFKQLIEKNELLEWACYLDHYYGTPSAIVNEQLFGGKDVILEIDVQGALQIKEKVQDAILIFLLPPSFEELEKRLKNRATDEISVINSRINKALEELHYANQYDYLVINENVLTASNDLRSIIRAEKLKVKRNVDPLQNFNN